MQNLRRIFYGVSLLPIKTLPYRLAKRFGWISRYLLTATLNLTGKSGCRNIGSEYSGELQVLKLLKNGPMGEKGSSFLLPKDDVMYKFVLAYGYWEKEESHFFATQISKCGIDGNVVFVDIGANCGLITRQILNQIPSQIRVVAVEPLALHVSALKSNLEGFQRTHDIEIIDCALDFTPENSEVFVELKNRGNTSLIRVDSDNQNFRKETVKTLSPSDFSNKFEKRNLKIFIKCDIQGLDAKVLKSTFFWEDVQAAIVEVWSIEGIAESDVETTIRNFGHLSTWYWDNNPKKSADPKSVRDFWLSGTSQMRNLYMIRN